ncbi:MAG: C25 family cysteine peptidase [Thermoplasmata archaeon]
MDKNDFLISAIFAVLVAVLIVTYAATAVGELPTEEKGISEPDMVYYYRFEDLVLKDNDAYQTIEMEGATFTREEGGPNLPLVTKNLLVPEGSEVKDLTVEFNGLKRVGDGVRLKKGDIRILSGFDPIEKNPHIDIVDDGEVYPSQSYSYDVQSYRGVDIISLGMIPVEYDSGSGELFFYEEAEVKINLAEKTRAEHHFVGEKDLDYLREMIDNDKVLDRLSPVENTRNPDYEYLIITTSSMESSFQTLLDHKINTLGFTGAIVLKSDIEAGYSGIDTQEKIRNCIIDYYQNHGTRYVVLGGDTMDSSENDIIPHRGLWTELTANNGMYEVTINSYIPSDWYYAGLDGDFNADGDDTWGEWEDDCDWLRDVFVGRIPAKDSTEADAMINKIIHYETNPVPEKLYEACQDDSNNIGDLKVMKTGGQMVVGVNNILPSSYAIESDFESDGGYTISDYEDGIKGTNGGSPFFVNHCGHGSATSYQLTGSDSYSSSDASSLTNSYYPIHFSIACMSGSYDGVQVDQNALLFGGCIDGSKTSDGDCLSEALVKNPNGGMSACLLNSRLGLAGGDDGTGCDGEVDNNIFHAIFDHDFEYIGQAYQWATEALGPAYHPGYKTNNGPDTMANGYKWQIFEVNLLGDPAMAVLQKDTIMGTVKDEQGDVVWNATVDATLNGQTLSKITGADGFYAFTLEDFGSYSHGDNIHLTASKDGLTDEMDISVDTTILQQEVPDMTLTSGQVLTVDITLSGPSGTTDGWNFISSALMPSNTDIDSILNDPTNGIYGSYDKVFSYDAESQEWLSYVPDRGSHYNDLSSLDEQRGLWIHLTADDTLTIEGTEPSTTDILLYPGWNMVGYPSETDRTASSTLPPEVTKIGILDGTSPYNIQYTSDLSAVTLSSLSGYWVYNSGDTTVVWTVVY